MISHKSVGRFPFSEGEAMPTYDCREEYTQAGQYDANDDKRLSPYDRKEFLVGCKYE